MSFCAMYKPHSNVCTVTLYFRALRRPLIQVSWFQVFCLEGSSRRRKRRLLDDTSEFMPGWIYPNFLMAIVVCFAYSVIVPFMALAGCVYFTLAYCAYKFNLLYTYCPKYETGGSLFPTLYSYTLTGLQLANLTMLGYVGIKEGWAQFAILLPLLPIVELFRSYTNTAYARQMTVLSREGALRVGSFLFTSLVNLVSQIASPF